MIIVESNFSIFSIEYLGEIATKFENTLACLSGAWMSSNHEKNGGKKFRDTLSLRDRYWGADRMCSHPSAHTGRKH